MKKLVFIPLLINAFACGTSLSWFKHRSSAIVIDARLKMNPNEQLIQVINLSLTGGFYDENTTVVTSNSRTFRHPNSTTYTFAWCRYPGRYTLDFASLETDYKLIILYDNEVYESLWNAWCLQYPLTVWYRATKPYFKAMKRKFWWPSPTMERGKIFIFLILAIIYF